MNPLYKALGGGAMPSMPGPLRNFQQMVRKFQEFKANFQGDPEQVVKRLLQSGQMSQDQLNQLQQAAQIFQSLL